MTEKSQMGRQANEGEGNKTAAREYNESQRRFVKSGQTDEKARDAERAFDGPERKEMEKAEAVGKSHIAEEDPEVRVTKKSSVQPHRKSDTPRH
ncbi:MAG TPA: hypothetical protein VGG27_19045 [Magnetospirillaceae bacterium]|jgi:hypothetical protein